MARFDVHRGRAGWLLDVQSELTASLSSRIVVPMRARAGMAPIADLNPVFLIEGEAHAMLTHLLAAVPCRALGGVRHSLAHERDAITRALHLLFTGF